jgi:hypothetical protein
VGYVEPGGAAGEVKREQGALLMLELESGRATNPAVLSPKDVLAACEMHGHIVVQFSKPEAYTPALLSSLNDACQLAKDRLQVRFYGHYGTRFDASFLRYLPNVRDLSIDCLFNIINEDEVGRLPKLTCLSFGVFELDRPDFLHTISLSQLQRLVLSENRKRNIELAPLAQCASLHELSISGHSKGITAISGLPQLQKLTLDSYAKSNPLGFIAEIETLKSLDLSLGGRQHVDDLRSINLETLKIWRVRELATLGDLSRLPALSALHIEDQLQLAQLNLSGVNLERLVLYNCKNLTSLECLDRQDRLREFWVSRVALDLDWLRDRDWPPTARSISLQSGSKKWNEETKARLAAKVGERAG